MKIAFKTRLWGEKVTNIKQMLDIIADCGYQGVEFSQRPDSLGVVDVNELVELLKERNLSFLSLTSGTFYEKLSFLKKAMPEYFYVSHYDIDKINVLESKGIISAIHPGMFTPIRRVIDAKPYLTKYPTLKLICDTAHLFISGEDPSQCIAAEKDRVIAVHLKDWTPEFGRSGPRYYRGFVDLGNGIVNLDNVIDTLREIKYDQWLVVEIGQSGKNILDKIESSSIWLGKRNFKIKKRITKNNQAAKETSLKIKSSTDAIAYFRETIMLASVQDISSFYSSIAEAFNLVIPSKLIMIWACSPSQNQMGLVFSQPEIEDIKDTEIRVLLTQDLSGVAIERQAPITVFDLDCENPGQKFGYPERKFLHSSFIKKYGVKKMISIPIYNLDRQNHVRLLINIFPNENAESISEDNAYSLGKSVSIASDVALDKLCDAAAAKVNLLSGTSPDFNEFLKGLINVIQKSINCWGIGIFLVNDAGNRLELAMSTGTSWSAPNDERFYQKGEGLIGYVWNRNEPFLTVNSLQEIGQKGKSQEKVPKDVEHYQICLFVPLVDSKGSVTGVIRCRNKRSYPFMFTEDDIAILDSIGQVAVPYIQILLDKNRRAKALGRLTHELRIPLVAIRGAAEFMLNTKGVNTIFDYDYPGDIWSWSELMRRLLGNADLFRYRSQPLPLRATPTLLRGDVIAPAVKQVRMLLQERNFSLHNINYGLFDQIPRLWIDPNQFQQVIFNLLSNAIKHCFDDPKSFQVSIDGEKKGNKYVIFFRDWGPGIESEMREAIFEEGIRTLEAIKNNITGQGLGLWVVRQIIEAHEGKVKLTNLHLPTEFSIILPDFLASRPPSQ